MKSISTWLTIFWTKTVGICVCNSMCLTVSGRQDQLRTINLESVRNYRITVGNNVIDYNATDDWQRCQTCHNETQMSLPNDFLRPRSSRLPITLENAELDAALGFGSLGNAPLLPNWEGCCCRGPAKPTATTNSYTKSLSQAKAKIYAGLKPYSARLPTLTWRSTLLDLILH